ncbi:MAG: hypothetical protein KTR19_04925 [Hyphomicrobiales bacterium]|nr:hypothetical protein [Hyphomicrobiales bacterium]
MSPQHLPSLAVVSCSVVLAFALQAVRPASAQDKTDAPSVSMEPAAKEDRRTYLNDQRAGELLSAIDSLLSRAAKERAEMKDLPSRERYVIPPLWQETREDRENDVEELLGSVLEIVTDAPVIEMQKKLRQSRDQISSMKDQIISLREQRMRAPEDGMLPGILSQTQGSIDDQIAELEARIKRNEDAIARTKQDIKAALAQAGIELSNEQADLLLDSVLGGDLIKLVTAFQAARAVDDQLAKLLSASDNDIKAARRYFAMHAALFAMMVHAQDLLIDKIDAVYVTKLHGIIADIRKTRSRTQRLLEEQNRSDQQRALEANIEAQNFAEKVASFYRDYLLTQRRQIAEARERTLRDLAIADNTFETVEASFQLHELMQDARTSFEALQKLEAPGFDQVFKNETLRREFENLTRKLGPTS